MWPRRSPTKCPIQCIYPPTKDGNAAGFIKANTSCTIYKLAEMKQSKTAKTDDCQAQKKT